MVAPRTVAIGREVEAPSELSRPRLAMRRQRLVRHARFAVGNDVLADNFVGDTVDCSGRASRAIQRDATLITWAVAILKHKVADWYRSPVRTRTTQIDAEQDELEDRQTRDADGGLIGTAPSSHERANLLENLLENREMMSRLSRVSA